MKSILPGEIPVPKFHSLLLGSVAPRPIAFASTIDKAGNVNLSPFSFFNVFSSNPPVMIFSPARRGRDNSVKHTYENVKEVDEVVINIVNYAMVEQTSLASTEYDKGVNEFIKSGLTPVPSQLVQPPRVAESPAAFECKVRQIISLGEGGGAGNLVICEVLLAHFKEEIFDEKGNIDPHKIDLVARLGGDWYCRANGEALFEIAKPLTAKGIGVDQIPPGIRLSKILTGNQLGKLGNVEQLPLQEELEAFKNNEDFKKILNSISGNKEAMKENLQKVAANYLDRGEVQEAWKILLIAENL